MYYCDYMKMKMPSKIWNSNTSLTVALPSQIVNETGIQKGDKVDIEVSDDGRVLTVKRL